MRQLIGRVLKTESVRTIELPDAATRGARLAEAGLAPASARIELREEAAAGGGLEFLRLWERVSGRVRDRRRVLLVDAERSPLRTGVQPGG